MAYCEWCGTEYMKRTESQKYCSRKCNSKAQLSKRDRKKAQMRLCRICSSSFKLRYGNEKTCPACLKALYNKKRPMYLIFCPLCGTTRITKDRRTRWCSEYCRSRATYERNFYYSNPFVEQQRCTRKCTDCGRPTSNYRCEICWQKLRGDLDPEPMGEADFGVECSL